MPPTAARIPVEERLILALDVPSWTEAKTLVERLGDSVRFYKIGLELATTRDYFALLDWLLARDKRVFCDLKLYDIPATVGAAVRQISRSGASFLTVHGELSVMRAAAENKGEGLAVLAVTVLTSLGQSDLAASGITMDVDALTLMRAKQAVDCGCDGVIASGLEAGRLRAELGPEPLIVTPGIRPASGAGRDDQKRVATAESALRAGADYIVVGRPIREAADPTAATRSLQREIAAAFA
ncbi:MAG TPA: orotidine-5'-phosphate decarboxylase [Gammaproteobacteria bacterium]|nr:orotidine-5'-phosphate decarboxylase [Gammaproteobacteria bacterium]